MSAQNKRFSMKTIVVTGATKGIGKAICKKFASGGFSIAICSRNKQELIETATELRDLGSPKVFFKPCDVSNKKAVLDFSTKVQEEFGVIDVLVNNAGVFIPGKITEEDDGVLENMIETNLYSAYHITRALIESIRSSSKGHIFNICSTASTMAYDNGGSYCISKFAMLGMSKVLRQELREQNIKVSSVMPGPTFTSSWASSDLPEERFMKAEEIAEIIWTAYHLEGNAVMEEITLRPQLGDI